MYIAKFANFVIYLFLQRPSCSYKDRVCHQSNNFVPVCYYLIAFVALAEGRKQNQVIILQL